MFMLPMLHVALHSKAGHNAVLGYFSTFDNSYQRKLRHLSCHVAVIYLLWSLQIIVIALTLIKPAASVQNRILDLRSTQNPEIIANAQEAKNICSLHEMHEMQSHTPHGRGHITGYVKHFWSFYVDITGYNP